MDKTIVLGVGNQVLGDDSIGIHIVEGLRQLEDWPFGMVDFETSEEMGLPLLDLLAPFDSAIIVDCIHTGIHAPGAVVPVDLEQFDELAAWGNHYIGLRELANVARKFGIDFPKEMFVIGIEIEDPYQISFELSETIKQKFFQILDDVRIRIEDYLPTPVGT